MFKLGRKKVRGEWFKNEAAMRTEKGAFCFLDEVVVDGYEEEMIERMIIIHKGEWLTDMQDPPPEEDVEDIPTMERGVVQEEYAKEADENRGKRKKHKEITIEYHQDQVTVTKEHKKKRRRLRKLKVTRTEDINPEAWVPEPLPLPGGDEDHPILIGEEEETMKPEEMILLDPVPQEDQEEGYHHKRVIPDIID